MRRWESLQPELLALILLKVPKSSRSAVRLSCASWRATLDAALTDLCSVRWPLVKLGTAAQRLSLVENVVLHNCQVDAEGQGFDDLAALPRLKSVHLWSLQLKPDGQSSCAYCLSCSVF